MCEHRMTERKEKMATRTAVTSTHPDRGVLTYFFIFVLLSGGGPVAMRISYSEMPPFWISFLRFGLASMIFWILTAFKRIHFPKGRALIGTLLYGVLGFGISFILLSWGLVKTSASLGAIFLALIPLMTIILSSLEGVEPLTPRSIFGSILSVIGTFIAVGAASASYEVSIIHIGAMIIGAAFLAQGSVVVKRYPASHPIITNALAMLVAAFIIAMASWVVGETWVIPSQLRTWAALGYLVLFVSLAGNLLFLQVLNKWTASRTSYGFVIIPFVTVIFSAILTGEQITVNFLMGVVLVVAGVVIGALLPHREPVAAECATC